jgi:hypothetical protein
MTLFDGLRANIDDLLGGRMPASDRAAGVRAMKTALVHAKLAIDDLHAGVALTRGRLEREQAELATVERRLALAEQVRDAETVAVATPFALQHRERVAVLEAKWSAQVAEVELATRELAEMTAQLKAAAAGVGDGPAPRMPSDAELGLRDDAPLHRELDALDRAAARTRADEDAEARLAELKRKMGR